MIRLDSRFPCPPSGSRAAACMAALVVVVLAACSSDKDTQAVPDALAGPFDASDVMTSCARGEQRCGDVCVQVDRNPMHCGSCGSVCPESTVCNNGTCSLNCTDGKRNCNGSCIDIDTDPSNCGECGHTCASGGICSDGICHCKDPTPVTCGETCIDPNTDKFHCGATAGCGYLGIACTSNGYCKSGSCRTCQAWSDVLRSTTATPLQMTTGDFNGDSRVDVAVRSTTGTVTILLGNGDGTFTAGGPPFSVGASALLTRRVPIRSGDIDGDGKRDLVVGDPLTVWKGNGDGSFVKGAVVGDGFHLWDGVVGDLDGDGRDDIVAQGETSSAPREMQARVYLGRPDGSVVFAGDNYATDFISRFGSYDASSLPHLALADLDGDGHKDLFVSGFSSAAGIYFGLGNATFSAPWVSAGQGYSEMVFGDVNGDGKVDVVTGTAAIGTASPNETLFVFLGTNARSLGNPIVIAPGVARVGSPPPQLTDITGDGILDLAWMIDGGVSRNKPPTLAVRTGVGDGAFLDGEVFAFDVYPGVRVQKLDPISFADLNGDRRPDLVGLGLRGEVIAALATTASVPECK